MSSNIIDEILQKRKTDIARRGFELGYKIPLQREKKVVHKFPLGKGAVLEIKRASPSKGLIAPDLSASTQAKLYEGAGSCAISCLTEENYFKGNLQDLIDAVKAAPNTPVLRKDFLYAPEEVEVAYRCGADAVLVIARMLSLEEVLALVLECKKLGMTAFVELRLDSDLMKFEKCLEVAPQNLAVGVNSRNLKDFSIDTLIPAMMFKKIADLCKKYNAEVPVIFESGILSEEAVAFVSSMGFSAMLMGEAVARDVNKAKTFAQRFKQTNPSPVGNFWIKYASRLKEKNNSSYKPMIKICGITNAEDGFEAIKEGADILGFIFAEGRKRCTTYDFVKQFKIEIEKKYGKEKCPLLVAVITSVQSESGKEALKLAQEEIVDAVQFHGKCGESLPSFLESDFENIPRFAALGLENDESLEMYKNLKLKGQPRVLVDSSKNGTCGGTGETVRTPLLEKLIDINGEKALWLAGGLNAENVQAVIKLYRPELIDVSSGVEKEEGKKDFVKLHNFFENVKSALE